MMFGIICVLIWKQILSPPRVWASNKFASVLFTDLHLDTIIPSVHKSLTRLVDSEDCVHPFLPIVFVMTVFDFGNDEKTGISGRGRPTGESFPKNLKIWRWISPANIEVLLKCSMDMRLFVGFGNMWGLGWCYSVSPSSVMCS